MSKFTNIFEERMTFSFEVFPPKVDQPIEPLLNTIGELNKFNPDFISVTYGAGGTNKGRQGEILAEIVKGGTNAMAHFTCIGNTRDFIVNALNEYKAMGVETLLAMRGDLPAGWEGTKGDFAYATDLIEFIKETDPSFDISAAYYPETHIDAVSPESDIMFLRLKQEKGATFGMSQLFFDNEDFYRFRDQAYAAGVVIPLCVGVMPVLQAASTQRMALSNGCAVPRAVARLVGKYGNSPEDFKKAGMEFTVEQIVDLVANGLDGLHLYSLNKAEDISQIIEATGIRKRR